MILTLGAELDIATGDELKNGLSDLCERMPPKPVFLPRSGVVTGNGAVSLGGPPVGRMWTVRILSLTGADDHTTVAGAVGIYKGDAANVALTQLRLPGLAIPSYVTFNRWSLWLTAGESLFGNVSGTSGNPAVLLTADIEEYRAADVTLHSGK